MKNATIITFCLLLVACGGSNPATSTASNPTPEPSRESEAPQVTPKLSLENEEIASTNLPAISKDMSLLAYLDQQPDGMRDGLNAKLVILDIKTSKPVKQFPLLDIDEYEEVNDFTELRDQIHARLEKANAYLATLPWTRMTKLERPYEEFENCGTRDPETDACVQTFTIGEVSVTYTEPSLTIDDKTYETKDWSAKGYCTACSDDDGMPADCPSDPEEATEVCDTWCGAPAFVEMAAVDLSGKLLLFKLVYPNATDDCVDQESVFKTVITE